MQVPYGFANRSTLKCTPSIMFMQIRIMKICLCGDLTLGKKMNGYVSTSPSRRNCLTRPRVKPPQIASGIGKLPRWPLQNLGSGGCLKRKLAPIHSFKGKNMEGLGSVQRGSERLNATTWGEKNPFRWRFKMEQMTDTSVKKKDKWIGWTHCSRNEGNSWITGHHLENHSFEAVLIITSSFLLLSSPFAQQQKKNDSHMHSFFLFFSLEITYLQIFASTTLQRKRRESGSCLHAAVLRTDVCLSVELKEMAPRSH